MTVVSVVDKCCRACGGCGLQRVLELGALALDLCPDCGLAQLGGDPDAAGQPCLQGQHLPDDGAQVDAAIRTADAADLLRGQTVRQFGGSHGASWLPLMVGMGFTPVYRGPADVVIDCFGLCHDRDQRTSFAKLAEVTSPEGVMLMQFQSVSDIVRRGQWNALQRSHFAYYSLTALTGLLAEVGMSVAAAWESDLHGGTVMLAAVHARDWPADAGVARILADEYQLKITTPEPFSGLQESADRDGSRSRRTD